MHRTFLRAFILALTFCGTAAFAHEEKQDNTWWWEDNWWNEGVIKAPQNHSLKITTDSYERNNVDIPYRVIRPDDDKAYPAVLFQHGRRGLDGLVKRHAKRLAARGFVVLAADIYGAHFMGTHPIEHDYELEKDVNAAVDILLARDDISTTKACIYSHTRGGYYSLKVATTFKRQEKELACYVSYYPHLQDPNAPEAMQVYGYAKEIDDLILPTLIFIGDEEQYQRRRVIETSIKVLQEKGRDARLIIYPGVGRGFDFRPEHVRTFADDLASKDAVQRAATFIRKNLAEHAVTGR